MQRRDHDAVRKAARTLAATYDVVGLESLNITCMGASARGRGGTGVAAKRGLNRRIRASLWGFTQNPIANAMEAAGGHALKLPAMDSSRTDADVNAAKVMRQRASTWLELKATGLSDREASETTLEQAEDSTQGVKTKGGRSRRGDNQARVRDHTTPAAPRRRGCGVDSVSGTQPTTAGVQFGHGRRQWTPWTRTILSTLNMRVTPSPLH